MKKIIIFESKHGSTKKCVDYIKDKNEIQTVFTVKSFAGDLKKYDEIIICTPVYIGKIDKNIKTLIEKNEELLLSKKATIIICAMNIEEYNNMIQNNFSDEMIKTCNIIHAGGAYNFESLNFLSKFIVKKMTGYTATYENILYDNLDALAKLK